MPRLHLKTHFLEGFYTFITEGVKQIGLNGMGSKQIHYLIVNLSPK